MPRGQMTRYEILSMIYKLKDELKDRQEETENKYLADEYLNKVLDFINEFTYQILIFQDKPIVDGS